ncbi:MAG: CocE/NonD family hydrolase [Actinomycetota bacterium]
MRPYPHPRVLLATLAVALLGTVVSAQPGRAQTVTVVRTRDLAIPMSSGGELYADLYRPAVDGVPRTRLPTIVVYFPYRKDDPSRFEREALARFAEAGFAGLLVDIRGTGASPGEFGMSSRREVRDGYDAVEWAARQPWSDGRVGMWGYSYPGNMAALVAALRPPHLRAIVPASSYNDPYRDLFYPGGMQASEDSGLVGWLAFHALVRPGPEASPDRAAASTLDVATYPGSLGPLVEGPAHRLFDDFWRERALRAERIRVPALFWSGWDDVYPRAAALGYLTTGSRHKALVLGPWGHLGGAGDEPLELLLADSVRWFDVFLRTPDPRRMRAKLARIPPVRVFDVDASRAATFGPWPGAWRSYRSWPPPHRDAVLALCGPDDGAPALETPWPIRGTLVATCVGDAATPGRGVPVEPTGGAADTPAAGPGVAPSPNNDPKRRSLPAAAAAFLGPILEESATVTGSVSVRLWAVSQGTDADWVVRLVDVGPETTRLISRGWLRASHRRQDPRRGYLWHTHDREEPVVPGEPYRLDVEIWPSSYRLPAGHRLGLLVQSADTRKVLSQNGAITSRLLVGPSHPSMLFVPVRTDDRAKSLVQ